MWLMKRLMEVGFQLLQTGSSESVFKHLCDSIDYIDMHRLYPWIGWDLGPTDNATGGRHRSEFGYVWQDTQNTNRTGWEHGESTGPATGLWESHIDSLSAWEWFLGMSSLQERKQSYIDIYIYIFIHCTSTISYLPSFVWKRQTWDGFKTIAMKCHPLSQGSSVSSLSWHCWDWSPSSTSWLKWVILTQGMLVFGL